MNAVAGAFWKQVCPVLKLRSYKWMCCGGVQNRPGILSVVCWDTYYSLDISGSTRARKCIQKFFGRRHKLCTNIQVWLILRRLWHKWEVPCACVDRSSLMEEKEANSWHRYKIKFVSWGACLYLGFDGRCHALQKRVSGCIITQLLALQVAILLDYLHCRSYFIIELLVLQDTLLLYYWCCLDWR